ncbi:hypothetical protein ACFLRT_05395 [Acidobacteriota bacterium]
MVRPLRLMFETIKRFGLISGPIALEGQTPTWDVDEIITYDPREFAEFLITIPGVNRYEAIPGTIDQPIWKFWEKWKAEWRSTDERIIFYEMDLLGENDDEFGSIYTDTHCEINSFLNIWRIINKKFPAIWIYDQEESNLHNDESFLVLIRTLNG